jgi:hypothetical protein
MYERCNAFVVVNDAAQNAQAPVWGSVVGPGCR